MSAGKLQGYSQPMFASLSLLIMTMIMGVFVFLAMLAQPTTARRVKNPPSPRLRPGMLAVLANGPQFSL
jgi:hypothetical protein